LSKSLFATRFTNWHFHRQITQIWRFSEAFGSENYRLALSGEKHFDRVRNVIESRVDNFKAL